MTTGKESRAVPAIHLPMAKNTDAYERAPRSWAKGERAPSHVGADRRTAQSARGSA